MATGSSQLRVRRAECLVLLGRYSEAQDIVHDMLRADRSATAGGRGLELRGGEEVMDGRRAVKLA